MTFQQLLTAAVLVAANLGAVAADSKVGNIQIQQPYARATAAGQPTGGGFVKFENKGEADRLLSATAAISSTVELHSMKMEGDVMRMRQIDAIDLPAGQTVELKPGGLHIMFMGLKAPLKAGEKFPLTLKFEKGGTVTVDMVIQAAGAGGMDKHEHSKH